MVTRGPSVDEDDGRVQAARIVVFEGIQPFFLYSDAQSEILVCFVQEASRVIGL